MYIRLYKVPYHDTAFEKVTPVYKKKSPGQPACACVVGRSTPQFSRFGDSLQPFTDNESLAYKHKTNDINNNILLRVTTVDMTHFATVRATRARVTRAQHFVTVCWDCYSVCYTAVSVALKIMNASR